MQIHREDKTIHFKIVYHGVGLGGKTTNLHQIFSRVCPEENYRKKYWKFRPKKIKH